MSFIRLLAMNGSVDRKCPGSQYKAVRNPFPDFGSVGRSVATQTATTSREDAKKTMTTPSLFDEQGRATDPVQETPPPAEEQGMKILSVGVFMPVLNRLPAKEAFWSKVKNWFRREKKPQPAPVQAEWPMDRVVVVRNDLSDSDYEVVWAENKTPAGAEKPKGQQLVGRAWKKVNPFQKPEPVQQQAEPVEVTQ
jgi:hypothetical protein